MGLMSRNTILQHPDGYNSCLPEKFSFCTSEHILNSWEEFTN